MRPHCGSAAFVPVGNGLFFVSYPTATRTQPLPENGVKEGATELHTLKEKLERGVAQLESWVESFEVHKRRRPTDLRFAHLLVQRAIS